MVYLAVGTLSLVKAIAVRNDRERFRRELFDAALFLGVGLALRRFGKLKAQKRRELEAQLPDWVADAMRSEAAQSRLRSITTQSLGRSNSEPDPTLRDRARSVLGSP